MLHTININGNRIDMDNICDTYITPYQPVDKACEWILKKHPELIPFEKQVRNIIVEWQMDETLLDLN